MKVKIEFEVELPDIEHKEQDLEDFIRYETGDNGCISTENPFVASKARTFLTPIFGSLEWEYTEDVKED